MSSSPSPFATLLPLDCSLRICTHPSSRASLSSVDRCTRRLLFPTHFRLSLRYGAQWRRLHHKSVATRLVRHVMLECLGL